MSARLALLALVIGLPTLRMPEVHADEFAATGPLGAAVVGQGLDTGGGPAEVRQAVAIPAYPSVAGSAPWYDAWSYANADTEEEEVRLLTTEFKFAGTAIFGGADVSQFRSEVSKRRRTGKSIYLYYARIRSGPEADHFDLTKVATDTLDAIEGEAAPFPMPKDAEDPRLTELRAALGTRYVKSIATGLRLAVYCRLETTDATLQEKATNAIKGSVGFAGIGFSMGSSEAADAAAALHAASVSVTASIVSGGVVRAEMDDQGTPVKATVLPQLRGIDSVREFIRDLAERRITIQPATIAISDAPLLGLLRSRYPNVRGLLAVPPREVPESVLEVWGDQFIHGEQSRKVTVDGTYGPHAVVSDSATPDSSYVQFDVLCRVGGRYDLYVEYASGEGDSRPAKLYLNGDIVHQAAMGLPTNGQMTRIYMGTWPLAAGTNHIRFEAPPRRPLPWIQLLRLYRIPG